MKKNSVKITGMHCRSCKTLIETELSDLPGVKRADVNFSTGNLSLEYDEAEITDKEIFKEIKKLNYGVSPIADEEKIDKRSGRKPLFMAGALIIVLIFGYFIIDRLGLLSLMGKLNEGTISVWLVFVIGLLASFHCVGMCGGLIVSYSVSRPESTGKNILKGMKPHIFYNLGRLISYTIVGTVLGGIGSFFGLNPSVSGYILIIAAGFMVLMGLSLMTEHRLLKAIKLKTPDFIARFLFRNRRSDKPKGPFIIGLLTAFMPCGPLQAMQLFALTTGSAWQGAVAMGVYALGTFPVLLLFGGILSLINRSRVKQMMRFSGVVVIGLALLMLNRGLTNFGLGARTLLAKNSVAQTQISPSSPSGEVQTVKMAVTYRGYQPNVLYIKKGIPVRWVISGDEITGCTNEILLPDYNIKQKLHSGENIIEFTPTRSGELKFSCWMRMVWGKFIVTEEGASAPAAAKTAETTDDIGKTLM